LRRGTFGARAGSLADDASPGESSGARWTRRLSLEERAAELARAELLVRRDIRRAFLGALLGCAASLAVGLALMGWAIHTTDPALGQIAFLSGLILGYTGIVTTLARYYLRGEREGWWM
jgi:hypothetical protein